MRLQPSSTKSPSNLILALTVISSLLIFGLWLPFGFHLIGLIEEWGVLGLYTQYGVFFISDPSSPLAYHSLRPLIFFPHAIAHFLDLNSFDYWNVLLILSLLAKSLGAGLLFWQATGSRRWSMIVALLIIIYPADTMQLSMRSLHINWSLSLLLLANALLITAYRASKPVLSYSLGIIAAIMLWMAIAMYEAALPLSMLFFLITYVREGLQASIKGWWAKKSLVFIWLASITLYLVYAFMALHKVNSYQSELLNHASIVDILKSSYTKLFNPGLMRSLIGGWFDAIRIAAAEISFIGYLYVAGVTALILSAMFYFIKKYHLNEDSIKKAQITRLAVVSLILVMLGYSPYLLSLSHQLINQRTYLFATLGATFFWGAILLGIAQWKKIIAMGIASIFIFFGLASQLFQFHHYVQLSETQRSLLRNIVANYDGIKHPSNLILLDESMKLGHTWMLIEGDLEGALTYFYGRNELPIEVCQMPGREWRSTDAWGREGLCVENKNEWVFRKAATTLPAIEKKLSSTETTILKINVDGSINNDIALTNYREDLLNGDNDLAKRYRNILISSNWTNHFNKLWAAHAKDSVKWSFGDWWSLELPITGSGWREAEWDVGKLYHHAAAWKSQENASLLFNFSPQNKPYLLRGKFDVILNEPIRKSIKLTINQHNISYDWVGQNEFQAQIPWDFLITGINNINFYSDVDHNYYDLSIKLASFEISPV